MRGELRGEFKVSFTSKHNPTFDKVKMEKKATISILEIVAKGRWLKHYLSHFKLIRSGKSVISNMETTDDDNKV